MAMAIAVAVAHGYGTCENLLRLYNIFTIYAMIPQTLATATSRHWQWK